jgi:hypothetical protein
VRGYGQEHGLLLCTAVGVFANCMLTDIAKLHVLAQHHLSRTQTCCKMLHNSAFAAAVHRLKNLCSVPEDNHQAPQINPSQHTRNHKHTTTPNSSPQHSTQEQRFIRLLGCCLKVCTTSIPDPG